ncbi:MAG: hypothetical protein ACP5IA_10860, partial [Sediminispirochaetaceae bacterium]
MKTTLTENEVYRGESAVIIENGTVRAVVLPGRGAKVASLCLRVSRVAGPEQASGRPAPEPSAAAIGEAAGTKSAGTASGAPEAGSRAPDGWTEVLSQIDDDRYRIPPEYGREFLGEDGSGFDDMIATIDACEVRVEQG